jgi:hypothetical protein
LSTILNNNSYCREINQQLSSLSSITIHPFEKETLTYNKVTISKDELASVFGELVVRSDRFLRERLLFNIPPNSIKGLSLESFSKFEDLASTDPYTCFKDYHPDAKFYNNFLVEKVFSTPSLKSRFLASNNEGYSLRRGEAKLYLKEVKEFLQLCLLLIHFTSSLPLRGSKLCTFKFLNSTKDKRELGLDKATFLFILNVCARFKFKGGKEDLNKSNIQYLPKSVSLIFLYYIVLVVPFKEFLAIESAPQPLPASIVSLSPYFFNVNNAFLTSKDLSAKMSAFTNLIIGKKLNIQVYRQVILGVIKFFMLEKLDEGSSALLEEEQEGEDYSTVIAS